MKLFVRLAGHLLDWMVGGIVGGVFTATEAVIKESLPFLLDLPVVLVLCLFIPEITLALPRAFGL